MDEARLDVRFNNMVCPACDIAIVEKKDFPHCTNCHQNYHQPCAGREFIPPNEKLTWICNTCASAAKRRSEQFPSDDGDSSDSGDEASNVAEITLPADGTVSDYLGRIAEVQRLKSKIFNLFCQTSSLESIAYTYKLSRREMTECMEIKRKRNLCKICRDADMNIDVSQPTRAGRRNDLNKKKSNAARKHKRSQ